MTKSFRVFDQFIEFPEELESMPIKEGDIITLDCVVIGVIEGKYGTEYTLQYKSVHY